MGRKSIYRCLFQPFRPGSGAMRQKNCGSMNEDFMTTRRDLIAGMAGFLLAAAADRVAAGGVGIHSLAGTEWRPVIIGTDEISRHRPYFRFGEDGTVSGNGGCNGFGGTYRLDDDKVSFSRLASTRMACPEGDVMKQEHMFLQALEDARRVERSGTRLVLFGEGGEILAEFIERH